MTTLRFATAAEYFRACTEWCDPTGNVDVQYRYLLTRDAVEATQTPLLPHSEIWFQLSEDDRQVFRAVYIHIMTDAFTQRGDPADITQNQLWAWLHDTEQKIVRTYLRWLAVRQAKSEELSWPDAYKAASKRLQGKVAHGKARTMRGGYDTVQCILKAQPSPSGD